MDEPRGAVQFSRRQVLRGVVALCVPALSGLLSACSGSATPTPTVGQSAASASPTPTKAAVASPVATPSPAGGTTPTAASSGTPGGQAGGAAIKIGYVASLSGVYASLGQNMLNGLKLALDEVNNVVAGHPITLVVEDDATNTDQGVTKVHQLAERDQVQILTGINLTPVAVAVRDYVTQRKLPLIISNAGAAAITRDPNQRSPYIFRVSFANGQYEWPLAPYAYQNLGYKRLIITASDFQAGHEKADAVKAAFQKAGGQVVAEVYPPLNTADFGPYLQRIQQTKADAVWAFYAGADAVRFVQQYNDFGLKGQLPLIGAGDLVDEAYLDQEGDAALGAVTSLHYTPWYDSPENKAFVNAYQQKYGKIPNQFAYQGYLTGRVIVEAVKAAGGVQNTEAFLQALKNVQFTGPAGPFRFHPQTQNVVLTVFIRKVDHVPSGGLGNVVLYKYDNIDDLSY